MGKVELYNKQNIECLVWPDTEDGKYARKYLVPLIRDGVKLYIQNVDTEMMVLKIGEYILPITLNNAEYENSYVCSPYTHYVSYAVEELRELKKPGLEKILSGVIRLIGVILRKMRVNQVVHVNNWLLSTNLYPDLTEEVINEMILFLRERFPEHAIVFRSLNEVTNESILQFLKKLGAHSIASRQVYGLNLEEGKLPLLYDFKKDMKLLASSLYEVIGADRLSASDIPRMIQLYNMLYLDKYSEHNPCFTEAFVECAIRTEILTLFGLRKENRIDGIIGFFKRNGVMTTPFVGYDVTQPKKAGLYRLLSTKIILEASARRVYLNNSSGAAQFKRNRGSTGHIEYSVVYYKHLAWWRKFPWLVLATVINKIGIPLMKTYRL
ncbi:MAG: family N-acetyltransferase [Firmicutes bacterium]|jgi:hypothetical protein|nr:family N-acetyltransferase [Bacillota bacterium]